MIIAVYAKAGVTIPAHRLIRLTGNRQGSLWEVDLPAPGGTRTHAVALPGPTGDITSTVFGQAETFGPLVEVMLAADVDFDDALVVTADGRAQRAKGVDRNRSGVSLAKAKAGSVCPIMMGWSQLR